MQPAAFGVLLQPAAQPRPLAQQRLVGDLRLVVADRHEPAVGELPQDLGRARRALELGQRQPAAHGDALLADAGEPDEERAGARALVLAELPVDALGQPPDGAAGRRRSGRRRGRRAARRRAPATAPATRSTSRGSAPGSPWTSATSASTSASSTLQAGAPGRRLDRPPQLVAAHRADGDVVGAQHPPQLGVARRSGRRSRRAARSARARAGAARGPRRRARRRTPCARRRRGRR